MPATHRKDWSGRGDLNSRPPAPKAGALPGCATPRHELPYQADCYSSVVSKFASTARREHRSQIQFPFDKSPGESFTLEYTTDRNTED
jgi:hypothetical protein